MIDTAVDESWPLAHEQASNERDELSQTAACACVASVRPSARAQASSRVCQRPQHAWTRGCDDRVLSCMGCEAAVRLSLGQLQALHPAPSGALTTAHDE